jgi:hypothetical protein
MAGLSSTTRISKRIERRVRLRRAFRERLELDDALRLLDKHLVLERLDDVVANPNLRDLQHMVASALGGQHQHGNALQPGIRLQLREHFHPVHDRHRDIQENKVGRRARSDGQALGAVPGLQDFAIIGLEDLADNHPNGLGIVYGEDFGAHCGKRPYWSPFMMMSATR